MQPWIWSSCWRISSVSSEGTASSGLASRLIADGNFVESNSAWNPCQISLNDAKRSKHYHHDFKRQMLTPTATACCYIIATWCKSNCLKFSERAIIVQEEGLDAFTTFLGTQQSYHTMWYRVLVQIGTVHLSQHISEIGDRAHCGPCCGTEDLSISFHFFHSYSFQPLAAKAQRSVMHAGLLAAASLHVPTAAPRWRGCAEFTDGSMVVH